MSTTNRDNKPLAHPPSDGSELIPAEAHPSQKQPLNPGSTITDDGLINNYAVEPEPYDSGYPSPEQQFRYVLWGAAALLLVGTVVYIAFAIS